MHLEEHSHSFMHFFVKSLPGTLFVKRVPGLGTWEAAFESLDADKSGELDAAEIAGGALIVLGAVLAGSEAGGGAEEAPGREVAWEERVPAPTQFRRGQGRCATLRSLRQSET